MDLCAVEFYVERAKINGMFNHGAFWNKLNIYPSARKKKQHRNSFHLYWGERPLGIGNQAALSNVWVSVYWFIWEFFDSVFAMQDFEVFPKPFWSKEEEVVHFCLFIFMPCLAFFPHCHMRFKTGLCLFFGMVELSSLSPPHWAQISALWRQVNVTKHGAICGTVMHHRLTARHKMCTVMSLCSDSMRSLQLEYFHSKWDIWVASHQDT